jgi:hypothetical protein
VAFGISSLCSQKHIKREEKVFFSFFSFSLFRHRFASFFELLAFFMVVEGGGSCEGNLMNDSKRVKHKDRKGDWVTLFENHHLLKIKRLKLKSFDIKFASFHLFSPDATGFLFLVQCSIALLCGERKLCQVVYSQAFFCFLPNTSPSYVHS